METLSIANLPHIGSMLAHYAKEKRIYKAAWSRHQGVRKATVTGFFKKPTMQIHTLMKISHVLKYNFFADLAAALPAEYPHKINSNDERITALEKENAELKSHLNLLKELMGK